MNTDKQTNEHMQKHNLLVGVINPHANIVTDQESPECCISKYYERWLQPMKRGMRRAMASSVSNLATSLFVLKYATNQICVDISYFKNF